MEAVVEPLDADLFFMHHSHPGQLQVDAARITETMDAALRRNEERGSTSVIRGAIEVNTNSRGASNMAHMFDVLDAYVRPSALPRAFEANTMERARALYGVHVAPAALSIVYTHYRLWNMLVKEEERRGSRYEWVLFSREDMVFFVKTPPISSMRKRYVNESTGRPVSLFVSDCDSFSGYNDRHIIASRAVAELLGRRFEFLLRGSNWRDLPLEQEMEASELASLLSIGHDQDTSTLFTARREPPKSFTDVMSYFETACDAECNIGITAQLVGAVVSYIPTIYLVGCTKNDDFDTQAAMCPFIDEGAETSSWRASLISMGAVQSSFTPLSYRHTDELVSVPRTKKWFIEREESNANRSLMFHYAWPAAIPISERQMINNNFPFRYPQWNEQRTVLHGEFLDDAGRLNLPA